MSFYNPYGNTSAATAGQLKYYTDQILILINHIHFQIQTSIDLSRALILNAQTRNTQIIVDAINRQNSIFSSAANTIISAIVNKIAQSTIEIRTAINQATGILNKGINDSVYFLSNQININEVKLANKIDDRVSYLNNVIQNSTGQILARINSQIIDNNSIVTDITNAIRQSQAATIQSINGRIDNAQNSILNAINSSTNVVNSRVNSILENVKQDNLLQTQSITSQLATIQSSLTTIQSTPDVSASFPTLEEQLRNMTWFVDPLKSLFSAFQIDITKSLAALNNIFTKLQTNQYNDYTEFTSDLNNLGISGGIAQLLWDFGKFAFMATYGLISSYKPFADNIETLARSQADSNLMTSGQILQYYYKIERDRTKLDDWLGKLGYSDDDIRKIEQGSANTLPPDLIRFLYLQDKITESMHDLFMEQNGYNKPEIENIKKTYFGTPPVQDLITMAVREAFSPEIAEKFGQYKDYPSALDDYAKQNGLTPEWSRRYWASHWKLPSIEQGFEMFHRGQLKREELFLLLRANDVMPFWRDKLMEISHNTLRLVDIRNFYREGVIDDEEMIQQYRNHGYNEKDAILSAAYTRKWAEKDNEIMEANTKMLSQSIIIKAYKAGKFTREEAIKALEKLKYGYDKANLILDLFTTEEEINKEVDVLDDNRKRIAKFATDGYAKRWLDYDETYNILTSTGYTTEQAELELSATDFEREIQIKATVLNYVINLYKTWQIDDNAFREILSARGFNTNEIERSLNENFVFRNIKDNLPSLTDFRRWLKDKRIDLQTFVVGLKGLGYSDMWIDIYARELTG